MLTLSPTVTLPAHVQYTTPDPEDSFRTLPTGYCSPAERPPITAPDRTEPSQPIPPSQQHREPLPTGSQQPPMSMDGWMVQWFMSQAGIHTTTVPDRVPTLGQHPARFARSPEQAKPPSIFNAKQMCDVIQSYIEGGHPELVAQVIDPNDHELPYKFGTTFLVISNSTFWNSHKRHERQSQHDSRARVDLNNNPCPHKLPPPPPPPTAESMQTNSPRGSGQTIGSQPAQPQLQHIIRPSELQQDPCRQATDIRAASGQCYEQREFEHAISRAL
ncbi:hypothetical protein B0T16DRAFT_384124 [Cercophora newfieldiana]|uniref:Uncharacterized protein n=1 Tax=Cercophora newfieldiana TaxID=92897 RepID=A0AA39YM97_9PEZI|nr:hypothetical protein B0T16DRAFT_384124 [Cercophora newfieldiana]